MVTLRAPEDGAPAPRLRTEVLSPPSAGATAPGDSAPTFPLPVPEASAPVVHGREAAAAMPAAVRSSMQTPVVRETSRPHSTSVPSARAHAPSSSSVAPSQGIAGLVVGAVGMLALGGTVMWWTLHDPPAEVAPRPSDAPAVAPAVLPTPVLVPAPEDRHPAVSLPSEPAVVPPPPTDVAPRPADEPNDGRPRPRPRPSPPDTKLPQVEPDPPPPEETKTTPRDGKNPDVAPGLRNPFGAPPKN